MKTTVVKWDCHLPSAVVEIEDVCEDEGNNEDTRYMRD